MKIPTPPLRSEDGVASIEFALSFVLILILILGISALSMYVWAQQKLSYAAGEGTRALSAWQHAAPSNTLLCNTVASTNQSNVCDSVKNSLGFLQNDTTCTLSYASCSQIERISFENWQICTFKVALSYNTQNHTLLHLLNQAHHALSKSSLAVSQLQASSSINIMCLKENSL